MYIIGTCAIYKDGYSFSGKSRGLTELRENPFAAGTKSGTAASEDILALSINAERWGG